MRGIFALGVCRGGLKGRRTRRYEWRIAPPAEQAQSAAMDEATTNLLAQSLSLIGLMAATIEYMAMVQRRQAGRQFEAERTAAEEWGLRGLVRVLVADEPDRP
jgi:hypothetical protein